MAKNADSDMLTLMAEEKVCGKGSVALLKESMPLGCVSHNSHPRKSILRKEEQWRSNHTVKFSSGNVHIRNASCRQTFSQHLSNQQIFMCHNRFDPTPCGRKTRLGSHSSKTVIFYGILSHCLRVYVFSRGSSSNQGTGALIHGGAKEITMFLLHLRAHAMTHMWW